MARISTALGMLNRVETSWLAWLEGALNVCSPKLMVECETRGAGKWEERPLNLGVPWRGV